MAASAMVVIQLVCLISCFHSLYATEYVPVFMWESSSDTKTDQSIPALTKIKSSEFKDLLAAKVDEQAALVVFVEENLSVEDFSWKDAQGRSSYPSLNSLVGNSGVATYLPNVHAPLHSLRNVLKKWQHVSLLPEGLKPEIKQNETRLIVNLVDASENEDRTELLKRHDVFMTEVYQALIKKHGHVTAIYTAHHSSWSGEEVSSVRKRSKREANEGELVDDSTFYNGNDKIFLYASTVPTLIFDKKNITLGIPKSVTALNVSESEDPEDVLATLEIVYDEVILSFNFRTSSYSGMTYAGYWSMNEVIVKETTNAERSYSLFSNAIEAPYGFSYHCSQSIQFTSENTTVLAEEYSLTFLSLQVQPFLPAALPDQALPRFGDSYDCVYFFTVPILSGFFVAILFAWIMGLGICMIMDIKTMDRFDDPKGKTINVNIND